jgi:esterase
MEESTPLASLRIPGSDGVHIHLLEWSREGVAMLLVHGFSNEAHIWDDFAPKVADQYRVLAMDLRGHGDSDWDSEGRYDYQNHVADLEKVLEVLSIERAVLIGHSLGGRVCTLFAGKHPEMVAGLVIVDAGPELDKRGTTRISQDVARHSDPSFSSPFEYEQYLNHAYPAATAPAIKRMAKHSLKPRDDGRYVLKMDTSFRSRAGGSSATSEEMLALAREHEEQSTRDLWAALEKIECPALVVRGAASDILSADIADRMADEALKNGRLEVVGQAGHSVMTDNPDGFRDAVCRFVLGE